MAQFTAQGAVKLLFNGEGRSFGHGSRDPFQCKLGSVRARSKHRFRLPGPSSTERRSFRRSVGARARATQSMEGVHGEDDEYDDEYGPDDDLACFRGLVLDVAYRPVNVVCWRRAICLEFMEKVVLRGSSADVLEYYDQTVNSPTGSFYIPAVLRVPHLLQVVKRRKIKNTLSRKNILYRDNYACQYCSSGDNLTIDHVVPISRGGEWTWENLVTACSKCNSRKGQKTLEQANMKLVKFPKAPKDYDILAIPLTSAAVRMLRVRKGTPEEWRQYLGRSVSEP